MEDIIGENEAKITGSKEYKPVMVWYVCFNDFKEEALLQLAKDTKEKLGYPILLFRVSHYQYERVEIISINKATIVEDIQKYIDTKTLELK